MNEKYYNELRSIFKDVATIAATTKDSETASELFKIAERLIDVRTMISIDAACDKFVNGYQE